MKNKMFIAILIIFMFFITNTKMVLAENNKVNYSVFLYDENDSYIKSIKNSLQEIQKQNFSESDIDFYDGKNNIDVQMEQLKNVLEKGTDVILINLVDPNYYDEVISRVKEYNIPIVIFNREPNDLEAIKSYGKAIFVGSDSVDLGINQAKVIIQGIKENRIIDKNGNGYIDYLLLMGDRNDKETNIRSNSVISYLKKNNVNINEIERVNSNLDRDEARERISGLLIKYVDNVDLIIVNNDEMAIGAIEAIQNIGYNKGDPQRYIPVIGIDGMEEAINLIDKGFMEGTVIQDPKELASVIFKIGYNLSKGINPLENLDYHFGENYGEVRIKSKGIITRK